MDFRLPADLVTWQQQVREFVRGELQPHDDEIERSGVIPAPLRSRLAAQGLFGTNTPREYGGLGLSMLGSCLATEELAKAHAAFYYLSGINVHLGSKTIELGGSEEQKQRWLPDLASGRIIAALALTKPEAGSDAASIATSARREGDVYILNGHKIYITNAAEAGVWQGCRASKLIGADMVFRVADQTLQIFGGAGYSKDLPVERIWREVRVVRILDGTSEMMRRIVARHVFRETDADSQTMRRDLP
jgi:alkylation response protein AidB-like acyl-CoA dehydrogenase